MAFSNAMFIFEVVVENLKSFVESRILMIKGDFADVFSLELKDPKQMHIVMPEPLPIPPAPPKKGKKKKPKPKKKKGKKGKNVVEAPPPEPMIQSGQSVLFTTTPEVLLNTMKKYPLEVSLWAKEDDLKFIGATTIPWDPSFYLYLENLLACNVIFPPTVRDEYNVFEEGSPKLMARIMIQVKLTYLTDKITTSFRTLSEDPNVRKFLYTGMNSKTTSYVCNYKTTDEIFIENSNKVENKYIVDKSVKAEKGKAMVYADYKNAPAANLTDFTKEEGFCCRNMADKPPDSKYQPHETCPDIDFIVDYVRKIITSCNDNMRMLTPRPTIRPRIRATDIDRYCYCREKSWPPGKLSQRFRKEVQLANCPECHDAEDIREEATTQVFDLANVRGPCGKPDCRIARDMRQYLQNLLEEDNECIDINEVIGPCGSKSCTIAEKIQELLRREGDFTEGSSKPGLSTQCACMEQMQNALMKKVSCSESCTENCESSDSFASQCSGKGCPFVEKTYNVYYFTVEYDMDKDTPNADSSSEKSKYKYCPPTCPTLKTPPAECSKRVCSVITDDDLEKIKCVHPVCPAPQDEKPSPADSNIVVNMEDIRNPCCVQTCDVAERVKDFIEEVITKNENRDPMTVMLAEDDPCYCACTCSFKFTEKTTYCAICGGYECLGSDMKEQPEYAKPHPCPVYHKLYNKNRIRTKSPYPDEEQQYAVSPKTSRGTNSKQNLSLKPTPSSSKTPEKSPQKQEEKSKKETKREGETNPKRETEGKSKRENENKAKPEYEKEKDKKVGKKTSFVEAEEYDDGRRHSCPHPKPKPVPKHMGWAWKSESIPGLKIKHGWKPGAISKRLLRKLREAQLRPSTVQQLRPIKRTKKLVEDKPALIICKKDGQYHVEMQVPPEDTEGNNDKYLPLKYKIASADHDARLAKRMRRRQRIIQRAVDEVWADPYDPDYCDKTCLQTFERYAGVIPEEPSPDYSGHEEECSCSSEDESADDSCSVDWEIHFTPPNVNRTVN